MVEYPCWLKNCAFTVEDAPHVDACLQALKEHFRGAHPTKFVNADAEGQQIARFNQTWEEYIEETMGPDWANPQYVNDVRYYAKAVVKPPRDGFKATWRKATIEEAQAWMDANPVEENAAPEVAQAGRPAGFRGRPGIRPGRRGIPNRLRG